MYLLFYSEGLLYEREGWDPPCLTYSNVYPKPSTNNIATSNHLFGLIIR